MLRASSTYLDQTHTREILFQIWEQSILSEAQEPEREPKNRTIMVSYPTESLELNEFDIKVFEGIERKAQRTARIRVIMRMIFCCEEIRKDVQPFVSPGFSA